MKIKIKNNVECNSCHKHIPNYLDTCPNCGAFIRSRRNNLNIWLTIFNLFTEPVKTMEDIIFVKRKSGLFILFLVMVIGLALVNFIYMNAQVQDNLGVQVYSESLWVTLRDLTLLLVSYSVISKLLFSFLGYKSRIKDLLAVSVFAFVPFVLSIFLLLPVELGLFGEFWFTFHPFPWVIKSFPAYFLLSIHGLMLLWSFILLFIGLKRIYFNPAIALTSWLLFIALFLFILK